VVLDIAVDQIVQGGGDPITFGTGSHIGVGAHAGLGFEAIDLLSEDGQQTHRWVVEQQVIGDGGSAMI
jgi:hypothetical protein